MKEIIVEHLNLMMLFALIGTFMTWIAKRFNFFRLPNRHFVIYIRYPIIGICLYMVLFFFAIPLIIKLFTLIYHPLAVIFKNHFSFLIATSQILTIMIITCFAIIYSLFQNKGVAKKIWKENFTFSSALKDFGLGILTWLISFPVVACMDQIGNLLTYLISGVRNIEQMAVFYIRLSTKSPYLLTIAMFATIIAAPILEEWIFRGFIQTYLKSKIGFFKAIICSSLIFALFHLSPKQGMGNLTLIFSLFTLALYLGFLYEKQRSLIAPIALHMTFNSISVMRIVLFSN